MRRSEKKPTLTVVAGREGPIEGLYSNAETKMPAPPQKRKRRGPYNKAKDQTGPASKRDIDQERIEAYSDLEPHICDVVNMGRIAVQLWDGPNRELYDFAVHQAWEMLEDLRKLYYAKGWL